MQCTKLTDLHLPSQDGDQPKLAVQVYLAKPMLQDEEATALAAVSGSEDLDEAAAEPDTEGYDSEDDDYSDDSSADEAEISVSLAAIDVDSKGDDTSKASKDPSAQPLAGATDNRWYTPPVSSSEAADAVLTHDTGSNGAASHHINQSTPSSSVTLSDAASVNESSLQDGSAESARTDASGSLDSSHDGVSNDDDVEDVSASFDWVDDCDSTVCTLVVQKGQQQQELLVSGGITRQQLTDDINEIVSTLTAT